ncbi:MAG: hypothetical protein KKB51_24410, partial [Candidatus Riflebacteria bacterium]|nr:hypothetical protein [Candidatus Riflebacteria bacterium]
MTAASEGESMTGLGKRVFLVSRSQSPWQGYTGNYEQEQAGKKIAAIPMTLDLEAVPHLANYTVNGLPFLAIDRANKRVVANADLFGSLQRPNTTRLCVGEKVVMGKFNADKLQIKPWELVAFLLESHLIETYQHLEATLHVRAEEDSPA